MSAGDLYIQHVNVMVDDIDAAAEFYGDSPMFTIDQSDE